MQVRRAIFVASLMGLSMCAGVGCKKQSNAQATAAATPASHDNTISAAPDGNGQIVTNGEGFSLEVPNGWRERKADQPQVAVMMVQPIAPTGGLTDMLIVTVVPVTHPDHPPTIEEEVKADKRVVDKNHPEAQYGPVETAAIDANDARVFWVKYNISQKPARSHRMIALHNNKCYMVLFSCDGGRGEDSDQQFKQILGTWKWQ